MEILVIDRLIIQGGAISKYCKCFLSLCAHFVSALELWKPREQFSWQVCHNLGSVDYENMLLLETSLQIAGALEYFQDLVKRLEEAKTRENSITDEQDKLNKERYKLEVAMEELRIVQTHTKGCPRTRMGTLPCSSCKIDWLDECWSDSLPSTKFVLLICSSHLLVGVLGAISTVLLSVGIYGAVWACTLEALHRRTQKQPSVQFSLLMAVFWGVLDRHTISTL